MGKPSPAQVGRAAQLFVAAEINRRGGHACLEPVAPRRVEVLATDASRERTVNLRVMGKRGGSVWQTSTAYARAGEVEADPRRFWVLVDLVPRAPEYYVMAESWLANNIFVAHTAYLERHGLQLGERALGSDSVHHQINVGRVEEWRDCWDRLGIFA
jgi:hypothetical protein